MNLLKEKETTPQHVHFPRATATATRVQIPAGQRRGIEFKESCRDVIQLIMEL